MDKELALKAKHIRSRVLHHILENGGGYMSQACSSSELLAALYGAILNIGPSLGEPIPGPFTGVPGPDHATETGALYNGEKSPERDRFIFSPVHYALVLYATLIEFGRLAPEAMKQFNVDGTKVELIGAEHSPGHEVTAGSLAQAVSQALGIAMARKLRGETGKVWVFMSDGEYEEGQTWETLAAAGFHKMENLHILVDANGFQCDGIMTGVGTVEPMKERILSFGCACEEVDGHDIHAIIQASRVSHPGKPLVIIARTNPCHGLELLRERWPRLHYLRFKSEDEKQRYYNAWLEMQKEC